MNNKTMRLLFNPFEYIAGAQALGLGLAVVLLAGLIGSLSQTHFDGVLDTHSGAPAPLWVFLSEGIIDWACLAVVLLVMGRLVSKTSFRTIDVLGTQALARWPTVLISVVTLPRAVNRFINQLLEQLTNPGAKGQFEVADAVIFFAAILVMLLMICLMVYLMYRAYSVACNVKGGKAVGTFIGGVIVAEILSKLLLSLVLNVGGVNISPPVKPLFRNAAAPVSELGCALIGICWARGEKP